MPCPNVTKAAPAVTGSDLREACLVVERDGSLDTGPRQDLQLATARSADRQSKDHDNWFDRLQIEIQRSELLWDLGLLTEEHLDGLARRVALWREAVEALAHRIPGSLGTVDEEREALE